MLDQSPPHSATGILLWKSVSCVSQATSCRVCCGMASAPAPAGSADLSVIFIRLSLLSFAVWNKGPSVRKAEPWYDWTANIHAHGSHRGKKERDKLFCTFYNLGHHQGEFPELLYVFILLSVSAYPSPKLMQEPPDLKN